MREAQIDERFIATVLSDGTVPAQFRHGQSAKARTTAHEGRAAQELEADPALRETALAIGQRATVAGVIIALSIASIVPARTGWHGNLPVATTSGGLDQKNIS